MKKTLMATGVMALLSSPVIAEQYIMRAPVKEKLSFFSETKTEFSEWVSTGALHTCGLWSPELDASQLLSDIAQFQSCLRTQERTISHYQCDEFSRECRLQNQETDTQNVSEMNSRSITVTRQGWQDDPAVPYDCSEWENDLTIDPVDMTLAQIRTCKQDQTEKVSFFASSALISTSEHYQSVDVPETQVIPREATSCSALKQQDGRLSSGNYTLSGGQTVYCEMEVAGGGFQRVSSSNLVRNGNLAGGAGSPDESGSNPTNDIIAMANPTGSGYVIHQYGQSIHEYEVHPSTLSEHHQGRYIGLTLWVSNPNLRYFHNRMYFPSGNHVADNGSYKIIDTQVVNGVTWYKQRYIALIPQSGIINHNWYIGYGSGGDSFFTGITYELYTK